MSSKDFVLEESTYDQDVECESQAARDCVKVIRPGEPAWFRPNPTTSTQIIPPGDADMVMCQPCMSYLILFEHNQDQAEQARRAQKRPIRRWRVHAQEPGGPHTTSSFELRDSAEAERDRVLGRGGRVMIEDRWNLQ